MNYLRKLSRQKELPLEEIRKFITVQLMLNGAITMPEELLYIVEEVIIHSVEERYGLDKATARAYYQEIFNKLKLTGYSK